jgi:peptidoglycan/LPS O-acetylase OafA/YrhL
MHSRNIAYLPAVDQVRGFAALWILVHHSYQPLVSRLRTGEPFRKETMWERDAVQPDIAPLARPF